MEFTSLDELLSIKDSKTNRLTKLLKDPSVGSPKNWYLYVPSVSNDALDLEQTDCIVDSELVLTWTQENTFSFAAGDALFDSPEIKNWKSPCRTPHKRTPLTSFAL